MPLRAGAIPGAHRELQSGANVRGRRNLLRFDHADAFYWAKSTVMLPLQRSDLVRLPSTVTHRANSCIPQHVREWPALTSEAGPTPERCVCPSPHGRALVASSATDGALSTTRGQGFRRRGLARRSWSPYHNDGPQVVQSQGALQATTDWDRPGLNPGGTIYRAGGKGPVPAGLTHHNRSSWRSKQRTGFASPQERSWSEAPVV